MKTWRWLEPSAASVTTRCVPFFGCDGFLDPHFAATSVLSYSHHCIISLGKIRKRDENTQQKMSNSIVLVFTYKRFRGINIFVTLCQDENVPFYFMSKSARNSKLILQNMQSNQESFNFLLTNYERFFQLN